MYPEGETPQSVNDLKPCSLLVIFSLIVNCSQPVCLYGVPIALPHEHSFEFKGKMYD